MTNQQNARREKKTFTEECAGASMQSEHANTRAKYCAQYISYSHMSLVLRKPAFCVCENNDADQLRGYREADQRLCFRYTDSTILQLPKSEISSHLLWLNSPVSVGPGRKSRRPVGSYENNFDVFIVLLPMINCCCCTCINQMGGVNLSMKRMCGFEMKNNGLWALSFAKPMHLGKLKDTLEILKHI